MSNFRNFHDAIARLRLLWLMPLSLAFFACRSITVLLQRSSRDISRRVEQSTGSPSSVTSSPAIRKGQPTTNTAHYVLPLTSSLICRFAYVEFAEPEFVDAAMALDNSLFRGRLIKVGDYLLVPAPCSEPRVSRLRRNERTSPGSTEAAVAGVTEVVTEVVTAEEGEGISHTVPAEGAFCPTVRLCSQDSSYALQGTRSWILSCNRQK